MLALVSFTAPQVKNKGNKFREKTGWPEMVLRLDYSQEGKLTTDNTDYTDKV